MRQLHDFYCRLLTAWAKTDIDALNIMDDWGAQNSLLIRPDLWRELFRPLYRDYIDIAHSYGKKIFMHSDGYTLDILPDLAELGLDAINAQVFCIGLDKLASFRGKITFWGEIDRQHILPEGTEEDVRRAVGDYCRTFWQDGKCIAQLEFGPGAGRIMCVRRMKPLIALYPIRVIMSVPKYEERISMNQLCVISHTHWDREWYFPLELMRLRLVDLLDHCCALLAEEPTYVFHLDAQTIVLEDYLSIRPEMRGELEKYVRQGRLIVGPWYLQNDFYLTSGEATVRNLLEGRRVAQRFGRCANVGYCADQFGLISQLPQILRGFGIDNCIFGRGPHGSDRTKTAIRCGCRFRWSSSGRAATAVRLPLSTCAAGTITPSAFPRISTERSG